MAAAMPRSCKQSGPLACEGHAHRLPGEQLPRHLVIASMRWLHTASSVCLRSVSGQRLYLCILECLSDATLGSRSLTAKMCVAIWSLQWWLHTTRGGLCCQRSCSSTLYR